MYSPFHNITKEDESWFGFTDVDFVRPAGGKVSQV